MPRCTVIVSTYLPRRMADRVEAYARARGVTRSVAVRYLLHRALEAEARNEVGV